MDIRSIIALGDSHTAGCELGADMFLKDYIEGKISLEDIDRQTKHLAYPQYVADQLGVPCYNLSMSSGSNQRSFRLLPQALLDHPDSLVLFGYTDKNRTEFYYPDPGLFIGRDNSNYIQSGIQWYEKNNGIISLARKTGMTHPFNEFFVENILRCSGEDHSSVLNMMFYLQQACKNILHIFFFDNLYDNLHPLNQLLDVNNILNFSGTSNSGYGQYQEWASNQGFNKLPAGHYDIRAHQALGEMILKHLEKRNDTF